MPQARPYTTESTLDRAVDFLLPESLSALAVLELPDAELVRACQRWRAFSVSNRVTEDVLPVFGAIGDGAGVMLDYLAGSLVKTDARSRLLQLFRPHGEYMPAVLLVLADRLK